MIANGITDVAGAMVFVFEGATCGGRLFLCVNAPGRGVVGTDNVAFRPVAHTVDQLAGATRGNLKKKHKRWCSKCA